MTGKHRFDVVCIGESMVVLFPHDDPSVTTAESLSIRVGGAESNVAAHLVDQGLSAAWASRLGRDPFGERILHDLEMRGVDTSMVVRDSSANSGMYVKQRSSGEGSRVAYYRSNSAASKFSPDDLDSWSLGDAPWIHISGITAALSVSARTMLDRLFQRAHALGTQISFDINYRPTLWGERDAAGTLRRLANYADVVLVGLDEAQALWGTAEIEEVCRILDSPSRVVIKNGAEGAIEIDRTGDREVVTSLATPPAEVVELVGAGDAFAAGYLAGTILGESAEGRLARGHHVAAWTIGSWEDARPGVPKLPLRIHTGELQP